jgi:hypothetical protein
MQRPAGRIGVGTGLLILFAVGIGLAVGYLDSRPSWDDTGITAASLFAASAVSAGLSGRRPWLWALLVGAWVPILEIGGGAWPASLAALPIAGLGAAAGYVLGRAARKA